MPKKILVEILGDLGIKSRKKYPIENNMVVLRKKEKRLPAYKAKFGKDSIIFYNVGFWIFKRLKQKLMIIEGASECVSFNNKKVNVPVWDRKTSQDLFKANVIKSAGQTTQKVTIPAMLYIVLAGVIFMQILTVLISSGNVRL